MDGDLATTEADSPAAGNIQAKTGTRVGFTPAGQGFLTGRTLIGYVDAKSGRQVLVAIMVRDVAVTSLDDIVAVIDDGGEIATAIQQGY